MSGFRIVEHQIPCSYVREFPGALAGDQEDVLHLAVKQYIPLDNPNPKPGDVTIIGAHANGFPKELYEPLWEDLLTLAKKHNFRIRSIWIADVAHQGQSSVLNEQLLGNDPGWFDHPRDLMHMINLKREEMSRPLVGIGHSMGGNNLVNVALWSPRLFAGLILIDPVIQKSSAEFNPEDAKPSIARLSTFRRDVWPSREDAAKSFAKSPFYQSWDKRVFDRWVKYGLRELPTLLHPETQTANKSPQVTLTTAIAHEVHTFLRPNFEGYGQKTGKPPNRSTHPDLDPDQKHTYPFYRSEGPRTLARLPEVRPSVLYIFGGLSDTSSPVTNKMKLEYTGIGVGGSGGAGLGRVKGVTFEDIGHLIPMEASTRTAEACAEWLDGGEGELGRWRREDDEWRAMWSKKSLREKQDVSEKWKEMMGGDPRKKQSKI
ncbi:hypothetical protein NA57DRAFT_74745 [Rhizodiscina lignyota]|uniref:AB hydrolase-1 domain-containing protein n=1 Tax=Rhizodiscina lignyota TaxID=1504668 RepID=A0A9P4IJE2_9PEZI|nr:hypothetical protein NA57DRAFT_74745 [Rhizodiscina lignyota]